MASFKARMGWKRSRKKEKIIDFKANQCGKQREGEKIKVIGLFRSDPARNRKCQKKSKKIKEYHYGIISSQNSFEKANKGRK